MFNALSNLLKTLLISATCGLHRHGGFSFNSFKAIIPLFIHLFVHPCRQETFTKNLQGVSTVSSKMLSLSFPHFPNLKTLPRRLAQGPCHPSLPVLPLLFILKVSLTFPASSVSSVGPLTGFPLRNHSLETDSEY